MGELVGLEETKDFLQIEGTATDALLTTYISIVESEIETYCDRNLARGTYTEVLTYLQSQFDHSYYSALDASQEAPNLFLKNYPVINLTITHDGELDSSAYDYNEKNGVITLDEQLYKPTATYVAGYTTQTAPADIKGVIFMGVKSLYENNGAASAGKGNVKSKTIKDFSITYGNAQSGYLSSVDGKLVKTYLAANEKILNRYKNIVL